MAREHMALVIAALLGAGLGVALGYVAYASGAGAEGASRFGYWLRHPGYFGGHWWALFGAVTGAGIVVVRNLTTR
jgi:hypothetical protein